MSTLDNKTLNIGDHLKHLHACWSFQSCKGSSSLPRSTKFFGNRGLNFAKTNESSEPLSRTKTRGAMRVFCYLHQDAESRKKVTRTSSSLFSSLNNRNLCSGDPMPYPLDKFCRKTFSSAVCTDSNCWRSWLQDDTSEDASAASTFGLDATVFVLAFPPKIEEAMSKKGLLLMCAALLILICCPVRFRWCLPPTNPRANGACRHESITNVSCSSFISEEM